MGVKTKIFIKDLEKIYDVKSLKESSNGVSHTVYILNDTLILKLYEDDIFDVDLEITLLNLCKNLKVPKIKKELTLKGKRALVFTKGEGQSLVKASKNHIKQVGKFLKEFHTLTKNKEHKNPNIYSKKSLEKLILNTKNQYFKKEFESLKSLELINDGIIHGDLFLDNVTFKDEKLTCVFDFSDACCGDFLFDLAVIAISWCNNKEEIIVLLESYDKSIDITFFVRYIRYASLYYCVKRFLDNRDYDNILFEKKFKDLNRIKN